MEAFDKQHRQKFDIVVCIGPQHVQIAQITLPYIVKNIAASKIFLITAKENFASLATFQQQFPNLVIVDEESVSTDLSLSTIKAHLQVITGESDRAGWYFQQFLKMEAYRIVNEQHYLVWDADTIPLQALSFFDAQGNILIQPSHENHPPYFQTLQKLLGIPKVVDPSFISEHMLFTVEAMKQLIQELMEKNTNILWFQNLLDTIDTEQISNSGFSEYETYGNYVWRFELAPIKFRSTLSEMLKTYRFGSRLFGTLPSNEDLSLLKSLGFHYATFEVWDNQSSKKIGKNKRLALIYDRIPPIKIFSLFRNLLKKRIAKQINH